VLCCVCSVAFVHSVVFFLIPRSIHPSLPLASLLLPPSLLLLASFINSRSPLSCLAVCSFVRCRSLCLSQQLVRKSITIALFHLCLSLFSCLYPVVFALSPLHWPFPVLSCPPICFTLLYLALSLTVHFSLDDGIFSRRFSDDIVALCLGLCLILSCLIYIVLRRSSFCFVSRG
jgi:hypothetical protein